MPIFLLLTGAPAGLQPLCGVHLRPQQYERKGTGESWRGPPETIGPPRPTNGGGLWALRGGPGAA